MRRKYDSNGALITTVPSISASVITGQVATANGGTGQNLSASTGTLVVSSGTVSANTETGTGNSVRASSPTLAAPTLTSAVLNTGVSGSAVDNDASLGANSSTVIPTQQAVKSYVDAVATGLSPKNACRLATAAALPTNTYSNGSSGVGATLTGSSTGVLTVDGQTVALNDRILVKDESTTSRNGIYLCTTAGAVGVAYVLTRAVDFNQPAEIPGAYTLIEAGTVNSSAGYVCTNASAPTIGTTAITFVQFSAGAITAGAGLTKSGNTLSLTSPVTTPIDASGTTMIVPSGTSFPTGIGQILWNTTNAVMLTYDGGQEIGLNEVGWAPYAYQLGAYGAASFAVAGNIAAVSGTYLIPMHVIGHMQLYSVSVYNLNTSLQRTWMWDLYRDFYNSTATLPRVATGAGVDTFTPSAASIRTILASGQPIKLYPGIYWLAIQNRHSIQNFGLAANTSVFDVGHTRIKTTGGNNGSTLDIATSWTLSSSMFAVRLNGLVAGQSTPIL